MRGEDDAVTALQFGVNLGAVDSWQDLQRVVRRVDELGYDVVAAADHLGGPSPFATLAAISGVSPRLRLRTYVLNSGFGMPHSSRARSRLLTSCRQTG
jgi:alkanesulfonate monooxygenase SsuD/methylene tetrahydromethanopterin reductase-like flavin-dependent oxidoreductase (luciferase family)